MTDNILDNCWHPCSHWCWVWHCQGTDSQLQGGKLTSERVRKELTDMPEWREMTQQTGRQSIPHKWLASQMIWSAEELETLPVGTKSRTSHNRSPGGERRGKKSSLKGWERTIVTESNKHWIFFKDHLGKLLREVWRWSAYRFFRAHGYHLELNRTEL